MGTIAFNLNGFNFNHSLLDSSGRTIRTEADLLNRATMGLQVMHSVNTHNFPLTLASTGSASNVMEVPVIPMMTS